MDEFAHTIACPLAPQTIGSAHLRTADEELEGEYPADEGDDGLE